MASAYDPTSQQDFPTSAKPVFLLLGFLIVVLVGFLVYLYFDSQQSSSEKLPEELKLGVEELIDQKGIPLSPGSSRLEDN